MKIVLLNSLFVKKRRILFSIHVPIKLEPRNWPTDEDNVKSEQSPASPLAFG